MRPVIRLEYELRIKGGPVVESSAERGPLAFVPGRLPPPLETRIAAMAVGEETRGELRPSLPPLEIARSEFPDGERLEVGREFEARSAAGELVRFRVVELDERVARVRFLHPLADAELEYRIKVLAIETPASPPPLPARALGIDSAAIVILDEPQIH
jgi:FKBP-type peptidyl-prolyl cis-trans isomerase SlyD